MPDPTFRRPTEADHDSMVSKIDDWAGGRTARHVLPRFWFRHFTGTSWVAERDNGHAIGLSVGFISPDAPTTGVLHVVAVDPAHRRRGIGRELVTRFVADAIQRDAQTIRTTAWPDDRPTIKFLEAVGFRLLDAPDNQRLYGTPATSDFDEPGDDRAELELVLRDAGGR